MENDIEEARASNMEEDKASSPNKGKFITDIEMAKGILVRLMSFQQNGTPESRRSECCIYRVPKSHRNVNWKAYTPLLISIGPLHRENKRLEAMEKEKLKYFRKLTEQYGMDEKEMCDIVISIKNQEERVRNCYSEEFKFIESSDFVQMIVLDAVFIIQFFLESNDDTDCPKNFEPRMTLDILEDLMLFENQLPLFIIAEIYDRVNTRSFDYIDFLDLATSHFINFPFLKREKTRPELDFEGRRHFTDLLRNLMLQGSIKDIYSYDPVKLKYSAVSLRKAGVRFQVTRDSYLVNITFDRGVLRIPQLEVDHNFERLVRNIMAMEQCLYEGEAYICSYIKFMDHLIDSAEDVGLLVENEIIVHKLGDDDAVSNMINNLCKNIRFINNTYYGDISQRLNAHFENRFNRVMATLALEYLPSIWRSAATILLLLTFIQTISSVISLF